MIFELNLLFGVVMTIVVCVPRTNLVLIDRLGTYADGRKSELIAKYVVSDQGMTFTSGNGYEPMLARALATDKRLPREASVSGFRWDGATMTELVVSSTDTGNEIVEIPVDTRVNTPFAHGSGRDWFFAYYAMTGDVVKSFLLTCRHHAQCGGLYDMWSPELGFICNGEPIPE